eukprot:TRINITY_DN3192_c0_g3_i1.p1 TRINITY_DN3192_c0_g3~~TRINITY_DN3192_c0_g3_i1.p1  ORF type:complete len:680 (+),score=191.77 TRINITY_DN3192_c0_g3_i1:30-2042(+)
MVVKEIEIKASRWIEQDENQPKWRLPGTDFTYGNQTGIPQEGRVSPISNFAKTASSIPEKVAFMYRNHLEDGSFSEYISIDYNTAFQMVVEIAEGLRAIGIQTGDRVGLMSWNRVEWSLSDLAVNYLGAISVPVYDTMTTEGIIHVFNDSGLKIMIMQRENFDRIARLQTNFEFLETIIIMDNLDTDKRWCLTNSSKFDFTLSSVMGLGRNYIEKNKKDHEDSFFFQPEVQNPETCFSIVYTSGSTGLPKGAMISNQNILYGGCALSTLLPAPAESDRNVNFQDVLFSFLPSAHIFARALEVALHMVHGTVGFFTGSTKTITEDINLLKPTVFAGVPRLFSKIYTAIMDGIADKNFFVRALFSSALDRKIEKIRIGETTPIYDSLVFKPFVASKFGGRIRAIYSGSAPLPKFIAEFMKATFCAVLSEGYGCTETSSAGGVGSIFCNYYGHIGYPRGQTRTKLVERSDMGYSLDNETPMGEIYIGGPVVFMGYWNNEQKTNEVLFDGWVKTSDIGKLDETQNLFIIDRASDTFKGPQGEFIAPGSLENIYVQSPFIEDIVVVGGAVKLVAVVAVEPKYWTEDPEEQAELSKRIIENLDLIGKEHGVRGYEKIAAVHLVKEFTVENGLINPANKKIRKNFKKTFESELFDMLYFVNSKYGAIEQHVEIKCCV